MKKLTIVLLFLSSIGFSNNTDDSTQVAELAIGFYDWYATAIKERQYKEFQPYFDKKENGMTTLNFSPYIDNLKAKGLSDSLIQAEKGSYLTCLKALDTIPYLEFDSIIIDLIDYENIKCDHFNSYRWGGGQEGIDGIKVYAFEIKGEKAYLLADFYNQYKSDKSFWKRYFKIEFIKENGEWKINKL